MNRMQEHQPAEWPSNYRVKQHCGNHRFKSWYVDSRCRQAEYKRNKCLSNKWDSGFWGALLFPVHSLGFALVGGVKLNGQHYQSYLKLANWECATLWNTRSNLRLTIFDPDFWLSCAFASWWVAWSVAASAPTTFLSISSAPTKTICSGSQKHQIDY